VSPIFPAWVALQDFLREPADLIRQIRSNPHDVVPMPRPDRIEPLTSIPVAATQQRLQLGQLVLKNVRGILVMDYLVRQGRALPSDNSISHLVCLLSKVTAR
jgi:hypothetical protein